MGMPKIIVVEDSPEIQAGLKMLLGQNYDITSASEIKEAKQALQTNNFNLILLDVDLPDGNGFDFCKEVRTKAEWENIPIIFLTGQTEVDQRVKGFSSGGDDYVVKPFLEKELVARIEAKLKKTTQAIFSIFDFKIDLELQRVYCNDKELNTWQEISLTPIEFKLLFAFLKNAELLLPKDKLNQLVWGGGTHVSEHTMQTHISSLRKKLGKYGPCIKSETKKGYLFSIAELGSSAVSGIK